MLILLRWLYTIVTLIILRNYPGVQIVMLLISSVLFQILLIKAWPYESKNDNKIAIFNEVSVSILLYIMMLMSDYLGDGLHRNEFGYALAIHTAAVVGINLIKVIV